MKFQTAFHSFETADGFLDGLGRDAVCEGDGRCCNRVFGVDPSGRADFDIADYSSRVVEVEDETAKFIRPGASSIEIGLAVIV